MPNPTSSPRQPQIKLIILVPDKRLVKEAYSFKDFPPIKPAKHGVGGPLVVGIMPAGASYGERAVVCGRYGALDPWGTLAIHGAANIVRTRLNGNFKALAQIILRVTAM
jgi:hypothetical protein